MSRPLQTFTGELLTESAPAPCRINDSRAQEPCVSVALDPLQADDAIAGDGYDKTLVKLVADTLHRQLSSLEQLQTLLEIVWLRVAKGDGHSRVRG